MQLSCDFSKSVASAWQASLMINETDKNLRLAAGAVHFQSTHADDLGALAYVSTGLLHFLLRQAEAAYLQPDFQIVLKEVIGYPKCSLLCSWSEIPHLCYCRAGCFHPAQCSALHRRLPGCISQWHLPVLICQLPFLLRLLPPWLLVRAWLTLS